MKFKRDRDSFSNLVAEKSKAIKRRLVDLWTKAERLAGDDKVHPKKELAEREKKHERPEKQLKELEGADADKFESIKQDLSMSLEEVDRKIDELTKS